MPQYEGYHRARGRWRPSAAQRRVLDGVAAGQTNAAIAAWLGLSVETVKWHVSQLLAETGCADRDELADWWRPRDTRSTLPLFLARLLQRRAVAVAGAAMLLGLGVLVLLAVKRPAESPQSAVHALGALVTPTPTLPPSAQALQDAGLFIVHAAGPVPADNRAAASAVTLLPGDLIQFPPGMRWEPLPGVSATADWALQASMTMSGQKLYLTVLVDGGGVRFASLDDRTFRVTAGGTVLITAQHRAADGGLVDHPVAVDAAGHLSVSPEPVPPGTVTMYGSGQALDVRGLTLIGRLPPALASYPSEWFFTWCDSACTVSYRVRQLLAPVSGTVLCRQGPEFDLDTGAYVLQFRDAGTLTNNPTWSGEPGTCGDDRPVHAGDVLNEAFAHYVISAVSESGEPLSVVVAYDGSLYVGTLSAPAACPPCRGS